MPTARCHVIAGLVGLAACTASGPDPALQPAMTFTRPLPPRDLEPPRLGEPYRYDSDTDEVAEVSLTLAPCPGCVGATLRLGSDGAVRFTTGYAPPREGRVPPVVVDMLVRHARDTGYLRAAGRHGEDGPAVVTTVVVDDERTEVIDHAGAAPPVVRSFEWMISAAAQLTDWDPPPPDERPEQLRRDLCVAARSELAHRKFHDRLSPLGQWPPWTTRPHPLCLDTRVAPGPAITSPRFPDLRELTLQRGTCDDNCPQYEARVRADGRVLFVGGMFVNREGVSRGRMPPVLVEMLANYAVETGYPGVRDDYGDPMRHIARKHTSLAFAGGRAYVTSLGDESNRVPTEIVGLEKMIDAALTMTTWDDAPPTATLPEAELRSLCAPMYAEARARCSEALAGTGPYIACDRAMLAAWTVIPPTSDPQRADAVARCEHFAAVGPAAPLLALRPPGPVHASCLPHLAKVRARCIDVWTPEVRAVPVHRCLQWIERIDDSRRPGRRSGCEYAADDIDRDLALEAERPRSPRP